MRRDEVIQMLQQHRDELRKEHGVKSLSLFGSMARDEATDASDVDLLVEFDRPVSLFHLGGLNQYLTDLLPAAKVDLTMRRSIIPALRDRILGEAIEIIGAEMGVPH